MHGYEDSGNGASLHSSKSGERATSERAAKILDIDDPGVTAKFQRRTLKVARTCLRKRVEGKDLEEVESGLMSSQPRPTQAVP